MITVLSFCFYRLMVTGYPSLYAFFLFALVSAIWIFAAETLPILSDDSFAANHYPFFDFATFFTIDSDRSTPFPGQPVHS